MINQFGDRRCASGLAGDGGSGMYWGLRRFGALTGVVVIALSALLLWTPSASAAPGPV